jgi:hypothetical protein
MQQAEAVMAGSMWQPTPCDFTTEFDQPSYPRNGRAGEI